ncbi:MAG: hypothetical protein SPD47_06500 [Oscillospiraceae bacterium]|nr:hypothetical protein [Oscillospiraceae bacterium]
MKQEALTQAISMIDDELLAEAQEPSKWRRAFPTALKICIGAAACAAAVGVSLLIPRGGSAGILVYGEDPSKAPVAVRTVTDTEDNADAYAARAFALECTDIPVEVVTTEKTVVSISGGELFIAGENEDIVPAECPLELDRNTSLVWSVPLWDGAAEHELTAQWGSRSRVLIISFDENAGEWTIQEK